MIGHYQVALYSARRDEMVEVVQAAGRIVLHESGCSYPRSLSVFSSSLSGTILFCYLLRPFDTKSVLIVMTECAVNKLQGGCTEH